MDDLAQREQARFGQQPFRCRLNWGRRGAAAAAARSDLLVVVDTLTFSTAVTVALDRGIVIHPCLPTDKEWLAQEVGAEVAVKRPDVPQQGRFSLSPVSFLAAEPGAEVVLDSPNGAACCLMGQMAPCVVVGCLVNARAVAQFVSRLLAQTSHAVTVLACGERWLTPSDGEDIRFAIEDYLGAGAILSDLSFGKSPEAQVCEAAFRGVRDRLVETLLDCGSGVELCGKGYKGDVLHAARLDLYEVVGVLEKGRVVNAHALGRPKGT